MCVCVRVTRVVEGRRKEKENCSRQHVKDQNNKTVCQLKERVEGGMLRWRKEQ